MTTAATETTVLFPTPIRNEADALAKASELQQILKDRKLGDETARQLAADMFSHMALNAVQQLQPGATAHATAVHITKDGSLRLFVSDSGDGIAASLANNPNLTPQRSDLAAILLAVEDGVSGHNGQDQGRGLHLVMEQARKPGNHLEIHSRKGSLVKLQDGHFQGTNGNEYFGTMIVLTIPMSPEPPPAA